MKSSKKIILIGPSGTGKTSIKKTFFEKYSPISLLKNPLNPSRGINTSNYYLLDYQLGLFDLAGQENDFWLSNANRSIFDGSNLIICIFDITNSVESIIQFLLKIYQIQSELSLKSCQIVAFMHKIDLVSLSYVKHKMKTIHEFVTKQHPRGANFEIFQTSITKDYYYYTFQVLYNLLRTIIKDEGISTKRNKVIELFSILDEIENKNDDIEDIAYKLNIKEDKISSYIIDMQKKGIIESVEEMNAFVLSDSIYYFKFGLEKKQKKGGVEENLDFDILIFFLLLDEFNA